jgi:glucose/arabinose dehydrogenase
VISIRRWNGTAVGWLAVACVAGCAQSQLASQEYPTKQGKVRLVTVAQGLENPWSLAFLPDGRMLVTERAGRLRIVSQDGVISAPLAGIPDVAAVGQGGLLDVVLDPAFAENRTIYWSYSEPGPGGQGTAVARGQLGTDRVDHVRVIFRQEPKVSSGVHFGSRLVFARDGNLFVTLGERGRKNDSQDLSRHMGKIVRIKPDGTVPPDNPFVTQTGARPEIWAYGERNPQGAALHPETGQLWTVAHGAMGGDEVNISRPGRNYGWPVITYGRDYSGAKIGEGTEKAGMEQPIHYWDPSIAPSGAAFYTGAAFPAWKGSLLVGSLKFQMISRLELSGERVVSEERILEGLGSRVRDVRQGPDGFVYLVTDEGQGRVIRIEPVR